LEERYNIARMLSKGKNSELADKLISPKIKTLLKSERLTLWKRIVGKKLKILAMSLGKLPEMKITNTENINKNIW